MSLLDLLTQSAILILSGAAVALLSRPEPALRQWAPVAGLVAAPAWLASTWAAGQWGMFALSAWYAGVYAADCAAQWPWRRLLAIARALCGRRP